MLQRRLSYWLTQVYVEPYSNMRMWCGTLKLEIRLMTYSWFKTVQYVLQAIWNGALIVYIRQEIGYSSNLWKIKERTTDCAFWRGFSKMKIGTTRYDEIARGRQLLTVTFHAAARGEPIEKRLPHKFFSCHELFVRSIEKTTNNDETAKCCNNW